MEKWAAAFLSALQTQLKELRSSIIKDTCTTVTAIVMALGDAYDESAATMLPMLFELSGSAKKVMSMSAVECMKAIVTHCRGQGLSFAAVLSQAVENKSAGIRAHCMSVVTEAVTLWTEEQLSAHQDALQSTLQTAMQDSNADVRRFARTSFAVFWRLWPDVGEHCLAAQPLTSQRAMRKDYPDLGSSVLASIGVDTGATSRPRNKHGGSARAFLQAQRQKMREEAAARKVSSSSAALLEQTMQEAADSTIPVDTAGADLADVDSATPSPQEFHAQTKPKVAGESEASEPQDASRMRRLPQAVDAASLPVQPESEAASPLVEAGPEEVCLDDGVSTSLNNPATSIAPCADGASSAENANQSPAAVPAAQPPLEDPDEARMRQILAWKKMQSDRRAKFACLIGDQPNADEL